MTPRNLAPTPSSAFRSRLAMQEYWLFVLGTFLCFSATSQLSFLSVILKNAGITDHDIGTISSMWSLAAIVGPLLSPHLIQRYGALRAVVLGWCLILLSFSALQLTFTFVLPAMITRFIAGLGFGIFIASAIVYVNSKTTAQFQVYYLGIFSSMMMIPNLFGPALAEWYVGRFGTGSYFIVMCLPILLAIIASGFLLHKERDAAHVKHKGYAQISADPVFLLLCIAILTTGLLWGFVEVFLSLWLRQSQLPVASFFTPFAITMLTSRFVLIAFIRGINKALVVGSGLVLMAATPFVLAVHIQMTTAIAASVLFALGYSVVFPTIIVWANELLASELHSRSAALLNTIFNVGGVVSAFCGGYLIAANGFRSVAFSLSFMGPAVAFCLIITTSIQRRVIRE